MSAGRLRDADVDADAEVARQVDSARAPVKLHERTWPMVREEKSPGSAVGWRGRETDGEQGGEGEEGWRDRMSGSRMGREGDPCFWDCATVRAPVRASPRRRINYGNGARHLSRAPSSLGLCLISTCALRSLPFSSRRMIGGCGGADPISPSCSPLLNRNIRLSNVGLVSKGGEILLFIS